MPTRDEMDQIRREMQDRDRDQAAVNARTQERIKGLEREAFAPPRPREEVAAIRAELAAAQVDRDGWFDNAERLIGRLFTSGYGRLLFVVVVLLFLVMGATTAILAWQGELDDVIRALSPAVEVQDVPEDGSVSP